MIFWLLTMWINSVKINYWKLLPDWRKYWRLVLILWYILLFLQYRFQGWLLLIWRWWRRRPLTNNTWLCLWTDTSAQIVFLRILSWRRWWLCSLLHPHLQMFSLIMIHCGIHFVKSIMIPFLICGVNDVSVFIAARNVSQCHS